MAIDGNNTSEDEQRDIREICRQIKNKRDISYTDLFELMDLGVAPFYESTLGRGGAKPAKVYAIYQWIIANELKFASREMPHLFQTSMRTDWSSFIEERGVYGSLTTQPFTANQLHEISDLHPLNPEPFKLGQEFVFELDSLIAGSVIALDHYKNKWYPIPLDHNQSLVPITIEQSIYGFPIQNGDLTSITPMRQKRFAGEHGHCFVIGPHQLLQYYSDRFALGQSIGTKTLDEMAKRFTELDDNKIAILLENVLFQ